MRRFLVPGLFGVLFAFSSCHTEEKSTVSVGYLSEAIKSYCFAAGSYWVFQNDSNFTLDSIVVTATVHDFMWDMPPVHGTSGHQTEIYQMNLHAYGTSQDYNDYVSHNMIRRNGGGQFTELGQPIYVIGEGFNGLSVVNDIPQLTLNGNTFAPVRKLKITAADQYQHEFDSDTYLYYVPSAGVIKKETVLDTGTQSWSLVRWHVEKAF